VKRWAALCACTAIFVSVSSIAVAEGPYALEKKREWIILGTGTVIGITALLLIDSVEPLTLEEIAALDPEDVNEFDRHGFNPYREANSGDRMLAMSYLLPLTFFTYADTRRDWKTLGVMWVETVLLQASINGVFKGAFKRTRPYVYDPDTSLDKKTEKTARLSYYSGHTGTAAANSFFVAKVFNDYLDDWRAKALIWTGAALYPAAVGYLRRDSGHHFRTDVMTGYVFGAAIGILVPHFHRVRAQGDLSFHGAVIQGGPGVAMQLQF
jgi:membrane-associated phospholipid phosphatase